GLPGGRVGRPGRDILSNTTCPGYGTRGGLTRAGCPAIGVPRLRGSGRSGRCPRWRTPRRRRLPRGRVVPPADRFPSRGVRMQPATGDLALLSHFTFFIYPFVHDVTARNRDARLAALEARWLPWWSRLTDEELAVTLYDTAFFLPYIGGVLYPETVA